ncbi:MAG: carbohydrate porin [Rhodospirillaceae bacterium]|nr:carbohydrate porin [Rhodospirillaceae bacterium]
MNRRGVGLLPRIVRNSFGHRVACATFALSGAFTGTALAQDEGPAPAVSLAVTYTGDIWANTTGGLKTGEKYLDNLDLTAAIDAEQAFNIPGGTFFFYGLYNNNTTLSDTLVGDAQTVSNIDTTTAFRLYEAWYEQQFGDGLGSLKMGLFDLNSEFDAIDTAGLFLSSSHGIGPDFSQTGQNGPSIFPVTSLAARLQFQVTDSVLVRAAVLDGVPGSLVHPRRTAIKLGNGDSALLVGEIEADLNGTIAAAGLWHYTAKFDDLIAVDRTGAPLRRGGNTGFYVEAERQVTAPDNDERGLSVFGRFGVAESEINQFGSYAGAGLSYTGLLAGRPEDQIGLAVAHATNGKTFRRVQTLAGAPVDKAETSIELTYRAPLTEWLTVQPDAQWVINPGTDPTLKNAFVVGLRFEIGFGKDF